MTQLILLIVGASLLLGTMALQRVSRNGWPLFILAYGIAVALVLAGFGVFTIPGLDQ